MLPKLLNFLLIFLIVTAIRIDARRSRIDLPITNAAEAPVMDNVATASGSESHEVKVPAPATILANNDAPPAIIPEFVADTVSKSPLVMSDEAAVSESETSDLATDVHGSVAELEEECDPDMIGFEIVTG